jgi:hypothetical protein
MMRVCYEWKPLKNYRVIILESIEIVLAYQSESIYYSSAAAESIIRRNFPL